MTKINCDMGESFGIYNAGNDEQIMPLIDVANVACGFHASDPNHMRKTVELAKKNKVKVGAHPSFPDLQGFGRREMKMPKLDLKNMIMYQVGALKAFLDEYDMPLNHIKPHGSLYVMASKDEEIARAIADAVETFNVSIYGMANTVHEKIYKKERKLEELLSEERKAIRVKKEKEDFKYQKNEKRKQKKIEVFFTRTVIFFYVIVAIIMYLNRLSNN